MPALLFMGRRWGVGSDEFALPSLCSMALRVMWSVALVVVLFETGGDLRGCGDGWVVYTYMVCSLSTFALSVVVEWGITRISTRGSIADTRPRESLSGYLNVHMMLGAVQLVMAALGIVLITRYDSTCKGLLTDEALNILLIVVTTSQILDVLVTCCCCVLMSGNREEAYGGGDEGYYERFPSTEIEGQWENRCHWLHRVLMFLTCGLFGGRGIRQTDFEQLARVMARIFHTEEYLDVVPSDIAAGIVLLYHKQRYQRRATAARLRRSRSATGLYPYEPTKPRRAAEAVAAAAVAAAGRVTGSGSGSGAGDKKGATEARGGELSLSRLRRGEEDEESRGEKLSLTSGAGDGGGGGGGARVLPVGLEARSEGHDGFDRVRGRALLDVMDPDDRKALAEISHFARYSLAIYTWYLYVFERPCCGACDLLCFSCTGRSRAFHRSRSRKDWTDKGADPRHADANGSQGGSGGGSGDGGGGDNSGGGHGIGVSVRGDNWLGTHEAALLRVAGLHQGCEVVHAQFSSGITETPYCVMVDHAWRCVVVSIRGTMSLDDCLCDLQADPVLMEESGRRWGFDGSGMYAHQGVLARAEWVRQDLEKEGHIRALLLGSGGGVDGDEAGTDAGRPPRCRGYSLRLTGHSLGGSTGALLAYMLRAEYPSTRCVSISPLGGLLNSPHAEECGEFVLSAVLGEDVVPRLSVMAMERMRDEVLELIARTKVNKLTVMRSMVRAVSFPILGRSGMGRSSSSSSSRSSTSSAFSTNVAGNGPLVDDDEDLGGLVYRQHEPVPDTRYSAQLRRYRALVDQRRAQLPFPELVPAGRFVHYVKTHTARSCCRTHLLYTPVWATPTDFSDIVVSKRMFFDHIPTRTCPRFTETFEMLKREANEADASLSVPASAATAGATSAFGRGYAEGRS